MSRPPPSGRPGSYGPAGSYAQPGGNRPQGAYNSAGGPARSHGYAAGPNNIDPMSAVSNPMMAPHYASNSSHMGSGMIPPGGVANANMNAASMPQVSAAKPSAANVWENRPPEDVKVLSDSLGAPDYFPFLRTAPEENMRPPFLDQGYSEPFVAGEENEYGTMRDRFSGETRQIHEFRALIDQGLKTLTLRRQMMSRKAESMQRGPPVRKRQFPPISSTNQQDREGKSPFWEKLANPETRLSLLSTQPDAIKDPSGKWDQYLRAFCDSGVSFDRATWYSKVWFLNKMYAQQSAALRAQREATTAWSRALGSFIATQIRDFFKKVSNKVNQKSSAGEKTKQHIHYATRLLHWTYEEGIVAPDLLFDTFLSPLISIIDQSTGSGSTASQGGATASASSASSKLSSGASSAASSGSTTATTTPPEVELWYLDILLPYAHDMCLSQSTLRSLFRYCMGRIEQLVPSRYLTVWSSSLNRNSNGSIMPSLTPVQARIYSVACSFLRVIIAVAPDFVVVQNAADVVLDRISDRELILAHIGSITGGSGSPNANDFLGGGENTTAKISAQLMPKPMSPVIEAAFRNFAIDARRRQALLRSMSSPLPSTKLKLIDLLDSWNRFSDMKSFCDAVLDAAQGKSQAASSSSAASRLMSASMTPTELVNLICEWAMSPHRAVRDIYPPFVASALLRRLRATADWTFRPSDAIATPPKPPSVSRVSSAVASTPVQALFMPNTPRYESSQPAISAAGSSIKWNSPTIDVASLLLNYLDNIVPMSASATSANPESLDRDFFARMARLFGELTRCGLFSHDKYMRNLISRGLMDRPNGADDDRSRRHRRILEELPIFGDNVRDRMQRRILLYGTGAGSLPTDDSVSVSVVALIDPWIAGVMNPKSSQNPPSTENLLSAIRSLPLYHQVLVTDKLISQVQKHLGIEADVPITTSTMPAATDLLRKTLCLLETQGDFIVLLSFILWILHDAFFGSEHVALGYAHKYEKLFVCADQLVDLLQALHDRFDEVEVPNTNSSGPTGAGASASGANGVASATNPALEQIDKLIATYVNRYAKADSVESWKISSVTNATIKKRFTEKPMRVTFRANKPATPDFETDLGRWLQNPSVSTTDTIARLVTASSMLQPLMSCILNAVMSRRQFIEKDRSVFGCLLALVVDLRRRFGPDPAFAQAIADTLQTIMTKMIDDTNAARTLLYFSAQLLSTATVPFDQLLAAIAIRLREARDMIKSCLQTFGTVPHHNVIWQIHLCFDWICLLCCKLDTSQLPQSIRGLIGQEDAAAIVSCSSALLGTSYQNPPPPTGSGTSNTAAASSSPPSLLENVFAVLLFVHIATSYTTAFSSGAEQLVQEYLTGDALDLSSTFVREVVFSSPATSVYNYVINLKDPPGSYALFYRHLLGRSPDLCALPTSNSGSTLQETLRSCFTEAQTILSRTTEWNVRQSWLELQLVLDCGIFTEKPTNRNDVKTLQWFSRLLMEAVAFRRAPCGPVLERIVSFLVPQAQADILSLLQEIFDDRSVLDGSVTLSDAIRSAGRRVWAITSPSAPLTPGASLDNLDEVTLSETLLNIISQLSVSILPDSKKRLIVEKAASQLDAIYSFLTSSPIPRNEVISRWSAIRRQIYLRCSLLRRFLLHSRESNLHLHLSLPPQVTEMLLGSLLRLLLHPSVQSNVIDSLDVRSAIVYAIDAFMGESAPGAVLVEEKNQGGPRSVLLKMDDSFLRAQLVANPALRARLEQVVPSLERREGLVFNSLSRSRLWMLNRVSNPAGSASSLATTPAAVPTKLDPWLHLLETEAEPFMHGDTATAINNVAAIRGFNMRIVGPRRELTYAKGLFEEQERIQKQQRQRMQQATPSFQQPAAKPVPPKPPVTHIKQEERQTQPSYPPQQPRPPMNGQGQPPHANRTFPHLPASSQPQSNMPPSHRFPSPNLPAARPVPPNQPYGYAQMVPPAPQGFGRPPQYNQGPSVQLPQLPQPVKRQRDPQLEAEMAELGGYTLQDQRQRGYANRPSGV